jgi:prevent-host-death family protein
MADVVAAQVSVRELKTHLSAWLARAQAGDVVEVTSHHKPIARITGLRPAPLDPASPAHLLQSAIEAGIITWNGEKPAFPPPVKLSDGGPLISEIVLADRG